MNNTPSGDALLRRIENLERIAGLTGANAGSISFPQQASQQQVLAPLGASTVPSLIDCVTNGGLFTTGPSVTITIGASGRALVRFSGQFFNSNGSNNGEIYLAVDGVSQGTSGPQCIATGTYTAAIQVAEAVVSGLTPGSHVFQLWGQPAGTEPVYCTAHASTLVVQPM